MSLRREARSVASHGKRLLTLCDNLSAVCAFDKGRAKCRRALAIQIATGIQWHLRYVETARNPSDEGSRVFPSQMSQFTKQERPAHGASASHPPLPSSSSPARLLRQTAKHGRGGWPAVEAIVMRAGEGSQVSASQLSRISRIRRTTCSIDAKLVGST